MPEDFLSKRQKTTGGGGVQRMLKGENFYPTYSYLQRYCPIMYNVNLFQNCYSNKTRYRDLNCWSNKENISLKDFGKYVSYLYTFFFHFKGNSYYN